MAKTHFSGLRAAPRTRLGKKRKFRDPRLRWMDQLLRSLQRPAPEAWIPEPYAQLLNRDFERRGTERRRRSGTDR